MDSIGIALSGGGARGAAHLGVLKYIDEIGLKLSCIAGVSAGAVIGALYAAGKKPEDILQLLKKQSYLSLKGLSFSTTGIFSMDGLQTILKKELPLQFSQLRIPLTIVATDVTRNIAVELNHGEVTAAIMASAAVPVIYKPVTIDGLLLADGGIVNNLPASAIRNSCSYVIGSHVNKLDKTADISLLPKMAIIDRCFHMAIEPATEAAKRLCDIVIEPELYDCGMFQMKDADKVFEAGYNAARANAEELLTLTRDQRGS